MEILSKGEKIKRARIYKGLTLKEVCGDKISVSKLSCIENDKIEPDSDLLGYVAEKLELDIEYLKQDVKCQLQRNIDMIKENKQNEDYEKMIKYNFKYASENKYDDMAFQLLHLLFNYYINIDKLEKAQIITTEYYALCEKVYKLKNQITYYMDMAKYCYANKEYSQAANYYDNVRKSLLSNKEITEEKLVSATYNESACYIMLKDYNKAYKIANDLIEVIKYVDDNLKKAEIYHMLALLSLRMDTNNFEKYERDSYELYKGYDDSKARAIFNYAVAMFDKGYNDKALSYIKKSLKCFPKYNKIDLVKFMLLVLDELLQNEEIDYAREISDEVLNYSIEVDNIKFIEKSYYYKSIILMKNKEYFQAEMYMNLSLDSLMKFGNSYQIYNRYLEIGNMYHNMQNTSESLKYFNLAIKMEKSI
ncbi:helix-turn-helix domain-containing protein [Haloimpatiens sp. FM7330]|uniref:helix-turn-helix domain-containing protein n=1 Tax=Haloimpatiens sp. FM7330 TaxID=3298610 RepID=UPI003635BC77